MAAGVRIRACRHWPGAAACALALGILAAGCAGGSPRIHCEVDGRIVSTGFTFESFRKVLAREHGPVEAEAPRMLKSRSVEVRFAERDGRLVAEKVIVLGSGEEMPPARFFGVVPAKEGAQEGVPAGGG